MTKLEDLKPGLQLQGIVPQQLVTIVDVKWHGTAAVELTYKRADGQTGNQLLYPEDVAPLEIIAAERRWVFSADGDRFRLVAEAYRIHLAHLFDPVLAVHTSLIEPLPHQITGVYSEMLQRQPLRFLLADDPGAVKAIHDPPPQAERSISHKPASGSNGKLSEASAKIPNPHLIYGDKSEVPDNPETIAAFNAFIAKHQRKPTDRDELRNWYQNEYKTS